MLTEQEMVQHLRDKTNDKTILDETKKYVAKLNAMNDILLKQREGLDVLQSKIAETERNIQQSQGAISMLLELSAESEGLVS